VVIACVVVLVLLTMSIWWIVKSRSWRRRKPSPAIQIIDITDTAYNAKSDLNFCYKITDESISLYDGITVFDQNIKK